MRVLILTVLAVCLFPASASAVESANPNDASYDQCINQIDDDSDGVTDANDAGCTDDSPTDEAFSGPATTMGRFDARSNARDAAESVFGSAYRGGWFERLKCERATRVSFMCGIGWYYAGYVYIARIRVYNYVDVKDEDVYWSYALRGWKLTQSCHERKNWQKCARKRYLV